MTGFVAKKGSLGLAVILYTDYTDRAEKNGFL
jgi:hypothetical protein